MEAAPEQIRWPKAWYIGSSSISFHADGRKIHVPCPGGPSSPFFGHWWCRIPSAPLETSWLTIVPGPRVGELLSSAIRARDYGLQQHILHADAKSLFLAREVARILMEC